MFRNFLKITFRHLWRTRLYVSLNICGLAIGLACVLFATIFMIDERSFDDFHQQNPDLYRITTEIKTNGKVQISGATGQVQGPAFQSQIPEITSYARVMGGDIRGDVRSGGKAFNLQLLFVDSSFFNVFSFKLLSGNPNKALQDVGSVVITEKTAHKFFGRSDVVGQLLQMDVDPSANRLGKPLVISGVVQDPPANSSIQFDVLLPFEFLQLSFEDTSWLNAYLGTFVVLVPGADLKAVTRKFDRIGKVSSKDQLAAHQKEYGSKPEISYGLQPITGIHLNTLEIADQNRESGIINGSKPTYSILFLTVAVFILFMASVNFINISIAVSIRRAKEIGIRKVTGSKRFQIFLQFIGESAAVSLAAFLLALLLAVAFLPVFNELSGKQIQLGAIFRPSMLVCFAVILGFNTLLSGAYPAYVLAALTPVQVLYNKQRLTGKHFAGRVLIVFQFATAILLGISSLVFYEQMDFIKTKNLGYNPQDVVRIDIGGLRNVQQIKSNFDFELKNRSEIKQLALTGDFGFRETSVQDRKLMSYYLTIDEQYLKMLGIKLKTGRDFSAALRSDKNNGVLVNEAFVKAARIVNPIGKTLVPDSYFGTQPLMIVGVVRDFHYHSLKERIEPLIMPASERFGGSTLLVKIDGNLRIKALSSIQATFQRFLPNAAFSYLFLDDLNAEKYMQEKRWQKMISYATVISILICCLGLFGLAHLSLFQRKKETGIRLVLGATPTQLVALFSKGFVRIILVAFMVACPVGYYLMEHWLAGFAYHIPFPLWVFPLTGAGAIAITMLTVGAQGALAAAVNPALSLRSE